MKTVVDFFRALDNDFWQKVFIAQLIFHFELILPLSMDEAVYQRE